MDPEVLELISKMKKPMWAGEISEHISKAAVHQYINKLIRAGVMSVSQHGRGYAKKTYFTPTVEEIKISVTLKNGHSINIIHFRDGDKNDCID
jgi:hypothetical protein